MTSGAVVVIEPDACELVCRACNEVVSSLSPFTLFT
jgi:hypothetical protein